MNGLFFIAVPLVLMASLGLIRLQSRIRTRRRNAVLDAYAEREIRRAAVLYKH
jgi:hypothetical protein